METGKSRYADGDLMAVPALTKSGARISVEFTMAILRDDAGRPSGALSVMRDVSKCFEEFRRLKKQLADAYQTSAS
jgi:hypothetical protein